MPSLKGVSLHNRNIALPVFKYRNMMHVYINIRVAFNLTLILTHHTGPNELTLDFVDNL